MKKNRATILILLIIVSGITAISYFSFYTYGKIIRDDIMNISKLTSTNIYSVIDNELTKPIFVSLTMANDSFVKNWILNESERSESEITSYLNGIRNKYAYESVFLVSSQSQKYFHYNGLFKIVTPENDHDQWYYRFLNLDSNYALDVDQDEVNHRLQTVFVNCKIFDDTGNVIGVTGVGIKMTYLQSLLQEFEDNYDLEAFLVDENGLIQAHTNGDYIESKNLNDSGLYQKIGSSLYNKSEQLNIFDVRENNEEEFVISHYIEELNWYLIVRKDTRVLCESLNKQVIYAFLFTLIILISILYIIYKILDKSHAIIKETALLDTFGILYNRKGFDQILKEVLISAEKQDTPWCVFMMDLDHFKNLNDTLGHLQGDNILKHVMLISKKILAGHLITRWGGDEFSGIIYLSQQQAFILLEELRQTIENDPMLTEFSISVSIGLTEATDLDTEDSIIKRADQALYQAKSEGKNKVVVFK